MKEITIITRAIVKLMPALNPAHGDEYSPEYFLIYGIAVFPVNLLTKSFDNAPYKDWISVDPVGKWVII